MDRVVYIADEKPVGRTLNAQMLYTCAIRFRPWVKNHGGSQRLKTRTSPIHALKIRQMQEYCEIEKTSNHEKKT